MLITGYQKQELLKLEQRHGEMTMFYWAIWIKSVHKKCISSGLLEF